MLQAQYSYSAQSVTVLLTHFSSSNLLRIVSPFATPVLWGPRAYILEQGFLPWYFTDILRRSRGSDVFDGRLLSHSTPLPKVWVFLIVKRDGRLPRCVCFESTRMDGCQTAWKVQRIFIEAAAKTNMLMLETKWNAYCDKEINLTTRQILQLQITITVRLMYDHK